MTDGWMDRHENGFRLHGWLAEGNEMMSEGTVTWS